MFRSFFPNPKLFFWSALAWTTLAFVVWFLAGTDLQALMNIGAGASTELDKTGRPPFLTPDRIWTYQYIIMWAIGYCIGCWFFARNSWYWWSVVGSTFLVLSTYFSVQLGVWLNNFFGRFYDLIQKALTDPGTVTLADYLGQLWIAAYVLVPFIAYDVIEYFFTQHYLFRWRKAMNDYYMDYWPDLRGVEGAAQRVQEDTQKFARMMETLGLSFVKSVMTLIAFLPILWGLSSYVTELPLIGEVPQALVFVAIIWSIFGTGLLALAGIKLPGLEFNNQKVEAAYRKELVYGEDNEHRAQPYTLSELFGYVRINYFRLYKNYLYFNVVRYGYLNVGQFVPLIALAPAIIAGAFTLGIMQRILNAFNQVENSFQYLVNSWTTIVELQSIYKRLKAFEHELNTPPPLANPEAAEKVG